MVSMSCLRELTFLAVWSDFSLRRTYTKGTATKPESQLCTFAFTSWCLAFEKLLASCLSPVDSRNSYSIWNISY